MRSLGLYCMFMTNVRPIIRSIGGGHLLACTPTQQTDESVTGFAGSK
jgi:hypothetical protein